MIPGRKGHDALLSKAGELFVVKVGDKMLAGYTVKEANKDFVVIQDTATRVEGRVPLAGGETQFQQPQQSSNPNQQTQPQAAVPGQQQTMQPSQHSAQALQPTRQRRAQQERYQRLKQEPSSAKDAYRE